MPLSNVQDADDQLSMTALSVLSNNISIGLAYISDAKQNRTRKESYHLLQQKLERPMKKKETASEGRDLVPAILLF